MSTESTEQKPDTGIFVSYQLTKNLLTSAVLEFVQEAFGLQYSAEQIQYRYSTDM